MSTPSDRDRLLGLLSLAPPAGLREAGRFRSAEEYDAFLRQTHLNPDDYWLTLAQEITWIKQPHGLGGPGDWFPGGQLNLCLNCLDEPLTRGLASTLLNVTWEDGLQDYPAWSLSQIQNGVALVCTELRSFNLQAGDRVLLALPPGPELVLATLASLRLGLTCVPFDPAVGPARLARRATVAHCRAVVTSGSSTGVAEIVKESKSWGVIHRLVLDPGWDSAPPQALPEAMPVPAMHPCFLLADSAGTLYSLPSAGFMIQALSACRTVLDSRGSVDRYWLQTPAHYTCLQASVLGLLMCGSTVALASALATPTPDELLKALSIVRPRVALVQERDLQRMLESYQCSGRIYSQPGPELFILEGETVEPSFYQYLRSMVFDGNTHVVQVLSRVEGGGFLAGPCPTVTPIRPASVSLPLPGIDLTVVDDHDKECHINHGGFLALRQMTPGIPFELQRLKLPVRLGARCRRDAAGYLWTMGEAPIERPEGQTVSASELEAVIASLSGVEQVAVVRYQDQQGIWRTHAFVKLTGGETELPRIKLELTQKLGAGSVPESLQVVSQLPYSRSGKLLRSVLQRIALGDIEGLGDLEAVADPELVQKLILSVKRDASR
jgi:acetyl-CoA synthetase